MAENGVLEAAEFNLRRNLGDGKGATLVIQQVWQERGRKGGGRVWFRERWAYVFWYRDK